MRKPKHKESPVMGIGWYRPEQWERLREISADVDELEQTHAEWLTFANKTYRDLERRGVSLVKVDVDVEELLAWCKKQGRVVDANSRAEFVTHHMQRTWNATGATRHES